MAPKKGKGGGRKAFLKGLKKHDSDSDSEAQQPAATGEIGQDQAPDQSAAENRTECPAAPTSLLRPDLLVEQEPGPDQAATTDSPARSQGETRGQMVQRHKKELKALKETVKKLGKKKKDEADQLEKETLQRHQAELEGLEAQAWVGAEDTSAVATITDSLYTAKLSGTAADDKPLKATKAQKRREKHEKEEAEREARIAEEQAAQGDSERVLEEANLRALLQPLGLAIRDIPPDGHCMYRAVEDQLALHGGSGSLSGSGYQDLRRRTADYMRHHREAFLPFVTPEEDAGTDDEGEHFERYCSDIESTAVWGGQVELQALAQALKSHIVVYSVGLVAVQLGEEFRENGRTLQVCYQRHAYESGEHYNSVVPAEFAENMEAEHNETLFLPQSTPVQAAS